MALTGYTRNMTYTIRDMNERWLWDTSNRRSAERAAVKGVKTFGPLVVLDNTGRIITLVTTDGIDRTDG